MNNFDGLHLQPALLHALAAMNFKTPTPIQAAAIPPALEGQDILGTAQTGTGKTAAFSLPLLQRLLKHENTSTSPARHPVRALVLLPTRELADQVAQQVKQYAVHTQLRSAVVFGGMDMKPQTLELKKGVEVLVATPGRLMDHMRHDSVNFTGLDVLVIGLVTISVFETVLAILRTARPVEHRVTIPEGVTAARARDIRLRDVDGFVIEHAFEAVARKLPLAGGDGNACGSANFSHARVIVG